MDLYRYVSFLPEIAMERTVAFAPIVIVGVPRSGTTLLRVLLDSHSQILALPETPWLLGAYGRDASLREMLSGLTDGPFGVVKNVTGVQSDHVREAGRAFLETLFEPVLEERKKSVVLFKTPADIRHLDFLTDLLPDARYIHITRDGRDVAMSQLAKKGTFFQDLREYRNITFANVFRRWMEWEKRIREVLYNGNVAVVHLRYEDLIENPEVELRKITQFLGVPFEPEMLDYASRDHDYPSWEAGSTDVAHHRRISDSSVGKWRNIRFSVGMMHTLVRYDPFLVELGYQPSDIEASPFERLLAATYPVVNPPIAIGSKLYRRFLRPLTSNGVRTAAFAFLFVVAAEFLVSAEWLQVPSRKLDSWQPLLCFAASAGIATAFGQALIQRIYTTKAILLCLLAMVGFAGGLELLQSLSADRTASWGDFSYNCFGVLCGLIAFAPLLYRNRPSLRSA